MRCPSLRQELRRLGGRFLQAGRIVGAQDESWSKIMDATFGAVDDQQWEAVMTDVVGLSEMSREDVSRVVRTRVDCDR